MELVLYYELSEKLTLEEREEILVRATQQGLFPPKDVKLKIWKGTVDWWGIAVFEARTNEAVANAVDVWRAEHAEYFTVTKTSPALDLPRQAEEESARLIGEVQTARANFKR